MSRSRSNSEVSLESIGFGSPIRAPNVDVNNLPKPLEFSISKLDPEGGAPSGEYLYNSIALMIHCEKHDKIVLTFNERSEAAWLPFIVAPQNKTWVEATQEAISIIFSKEDSELDARLTSTNIPIKSIKTVHILRVQLPVTQKFICRLTQLVNLGDSTDSFVCCQSSKRLKWITVDDAKAGNVDNLWGPEVAIFSQYIPDLKQQEIFEFGLDLAYFHVPANGFFRSPEEEMLHGARIGLPEVEKLYSDFLEFCFPGFYMTYTAFHSYISEYMPELKQNDERCVKLFHGFNFAFNGFLGFYEFLLGLAAIEPNCPHNETRLKFIFRFYDTDQDQVLSLEEATQLAADLRINVSVIQGRMADGSNFTFADFLDLIRRGKLPNMEKMHRSPFSVIAKICENFLARNERRISASKRTDTMLNQAHTNRGLCLACRDKKYVFGTHVVRLDPSGRCVEPRHLPDYDTEGDAEKSEEISAFKYSQDYVFSTVSIGHTFLDMLRDFNASKGSAQKPNGFFGSSEHRNNRDTFLQYLNILVQNVSSLFECEEKLTKINSPAFVIGDLRGDLDAVASMEQILWKEVPVVANNFVFLGNYVNEGKWGVEVVLYLFALKIIAPNKFFLVRGSNEVRSAQTAKNGFQQECMNKYGNKHGQAVYNAINTVFDRMCLAIIIDESVLCLNSGVPSKQTAVEDIYNIAGDLKDPLVDPLAKDILTNTKCSDESIVEYLNRNSLSHLIRANQVLTEGFQCSANGKIVNVFSSSNYNNRNESTVICVDRPKIRIVKLDHSKTK